VRNDILRLANDWFAPAAGLAIPSETAFCRALAATAGVERIYDRSTYGEAIPRYVPVRSQTTYTIYTGQQIAEIMRAAKAQKRSHKRTAAGLNPANH
jgi:hypothetical protein